MIRPITARQTALIAKGIALHKAGRFVEAERAYQTVLRENPEHPDALNLMGVLAIEANQFRIAIDYMSTAVKLAPDKAIYRNNLGNALVISSRAEEAVPHLERAVRIDPAYAEAWANLGKAWRQIGDIERAGKYLAKALEAAPGFLQAQIGLAEIQSQMGQFAEAEAAFSRILLLNPRNVEALCGLAGTHKFAAGDPLIENFERMLRDPALRDDERAPLHHAYGKICNDLGRHEDAFRHFTRGKELKKLKFHMELHRATYAAAKGLFTPGFFAARRHFGVPDQRPVFIVGMPRSGTTLTEQILSSHHAVAALGEFPYLRKIVGGLSFGSPDPKAFTAKVAALSAGEIADLAKAYCKAYERVPETARRMVDKSPHNYELLGLIALMFPNAKVIHCRRSPLDNCVAVYLQNFNESHGYSGDLATLGHYYREYQGLMVHWRDALPIRMLDVDYESTVADFESGARALISHIGLDWDENCLRYFETKRQVTTPSRWQVRQPIYDSSVGRWKHYEKFLAPLKSALRI
ncbi:tetratricopeptide repeat protein [Nordella sp. HKS 07]|uniref:tetratricopeptide repeat-containing sulfotransferase family protein n=1 Tax=Nordella sp. HKS 07 TaxID=2712222 RepID=UPI0013E1EAE8|nr:sulfotransferase [Nordella sp. HKS 07]QIG50766.1 tetratricopeptide repeat protein [Nordella sp. HKS 07]